MARLRNEEMPTISVDLHDIFDVNPSQFPISDYLNGKFGRLCFVQKLHLADDYANLDLLNEDYGYLLSLDRLFRG